MDPLPEISTATIQRVQQGLAAARDRQVRQSIETTFSRLLTKTVEQPEPRLNGRVRRCVLRSLLHSLFRIQVEHPERFPSEAAILVANHLSFLDPLFLLAALPPRPYYYALGDARSLYNQGWKRRLLGAAGGLLPLERRWKEEDAVLAAAAAGQTDLVELAAAIAQDVPTGADMATLRQIDQIVQTILASGDGLLLFPEGRLGKTEGALTLPLQRGVALYALRSGVPIVPVILVGTHNLHLGKTVTLRVGEPIPCASVSRPNRQAMEALLTTVQTAMMALLPPPPNNDPEPEAAKPLQQWFNQLLG